MPNQTVLTRQTTVHLTGNFTPRIPVPCWYNPTNEAFTYPANEHLNQRITDRMERGLLTAPRIFIHLAGDSLVFTLHNGATDAMAERAAHLMR